MKSRDKQIKDINDRISKINSEIKDIRERNAKIDNLKSEDLTGVNPRPESVISAYVMFGEFQKDIRALKTGESIKIGDITIKKQPKGEYTLSRDGERSPFYTTKEVDGVFLETVRAGETGTGFMQYEMNRLAAKATDPKFLEHLKGKEFEIGSDRYRVSGFDVTNSAEPKPKFQKLEANGKLRDLTPDELKVVEGSLNERLFTFVSRRGDQIIEDLAKNRTPLSPNEGQIKELFHAF
jgi:hypothetical protein